jgi:hypothetical protein
MMKFPENYLKNKNVYKPLKLMHSDDMDFFDFRSVDNTVDFDSQCRKIGQNIDDLIKIGYGGIVTNISFDNYFEDENAKKLLKYKVEYCKQKGLRVWLYDERGYPSGKAGGRTLRKNPDFEAKGIVGLFETVKPGGTVSIKFPHGHEKVIAAHSYNGTCFDDIDIGSAVSLITLADEQACKVGLDYENKSENTKFIAYIVSKRLYEGTHAERNYDDARRYPDLMNKEAAAEFISNTYEAYREILGEYFGGTIEAIFTDEPSCLAYYLPKLPAKVHDKIDETIQLLPVLNWTNDFKERFRNLFGYSIDSYLPFVFGGNSAKALDIREDFHNAVSKFYEEAFFAQIGSFCEKNNIAFSGHLLMEENLSLHPAFEGNFFHQLKHMKYPGIDVLTTIPESILDGMAQVPKLVASVAALNGKEHVMSEASGYSETVINKQTLTWEQMTGACVLQYALGVDTFTSYYQRDVIDEQKYILWNETLGRINALMNGGTQKAKILLYYPIETANRYYLPQYNWSGQTEEYLKKYDFSLAKKGEASSSSWINLSQSLLKNQLDYFMTDLETLQNSQLNGNKININVNKNDFEILILPACDITEKLLEVIKSLNDSNIKVMAAAKPEFTGELEKANNLENFKVYKDEKDLINSLKTLVIPDVFLQKETNIVYMKKENENGLNYLFVNAANSEINTVAELYIKEKECCKFSVYNPVTDEKRPVNVNIKDNKAIFDLYLPAYGFTVVMAEEKIHNRCKTGCFRKCNSIKYVPK